MRVFVRYIVQGLGPEYLMYVFVRFFVQVHVLVGQPCCLNNLLFRRGRYRESRCGSRRGNGCLLRDNDIRQAGCNRR